MQNNTESNYCETVSKLVSELIGHLLVDINISSNSEQLDDNVKGEIYTIIREAVTNIKLHAQAERAEIKLDISANGISLFVQDDGCGFEIGEITKKPEGLIRIQKSVKRLGGGYEMDIDDGSVAHWIHIPLPIARDEQIYAMTTRIVLMPDEEMGKRRDWKRMAYIAMRQK